ncbi:MAG: hypothetical protein Q9217_005327 [Psora testacea]
MPFASRVSRTSLLPQVLIGNISEEEFAYISLTDGCQRSTVRINYESKGHPTQSRRTYASTTPTFVPSRFFSASKMAKETIYTLPPNGDQDQGHEFLAASWTLVMPALLTSIVRVLVQGRLTRNLGWDDHWIVITMISSLVRRLRD